ncbi:TonB-dependent siderophore receptor [Halarcobacter sp.]|uniref:TonB-dependent siderophore receptor n=1 Tax=Halarcobacter sp. TaxID=2321133 RepID=UPI003AFFAA14
MIKKKSTLIAPMLALALSTSLYAKQYSIENLSLQKAIEQLSKDSNMSYMVDAKLLKNQKASNFKNIEGIEKAFKELLKDTNLEAVIEDETILIRKKRVHKKENSASNNLGQVEVQGDWIGNSSYEDVKTYSGARTIIDSATLNKTAAKNIEDALRVVPGIQIQDETGTGVLPNISLRGLKPGRSANLNAMVNGIPAAIAPYSHSSFSLFPITMETLETIDIVRGGAAVHYGPNNVGGVVNFVTKPISTKPSSTIKGTVHSADNGNILTDTYFRTGGFINDNLGLQLQYNNINGESFRDHSDTNVNNYIFDLEYFPTDNSEIKSNIQYYKADANLPGAQLPKDYKDDKSSSQRPHDEFHGKTKRASVTYKLNPTEDTEFYWMNYAQKSERRFDWGWNTSGSSFTPGTADSVRVADREIDVFGTEPRFTFEKANHKVTFGTRYVKEDVDYLLHQTKFNDGVQGTIRDWKIKTDAVAAYLSDTISLMDGRLKVTPGIRYEKIDTDFGDNLSNDPLADKRKDMRSWLPGLSIGYQATNDLFLFTNAQRSLKSPQVAQVRKDGDLAAELAWNYEVGFRYEPNSKFSIGSTLYRIDYEDQIEYVASTQSFKNLGETRHQGIETQINFKPSDNTQFALGYTYLDTEQLTGDNRGNQLPWVAKHQFSISSDYEYNKNKFNLTGLYISKAFSDSANTKEESANGQYGEVPSYTLWNAKVSREVKLNSDFTADLSFGVNNIFDEDYYFRGVDVSPIGRVAGQGRTFIVSAQINF